MKSKKMGETGEREINIAIGEVLSGMRSKWDVKSEKYRRVTRKKQPDILILESGLSPVIIETEIEPANTLAADIINKLGEKTRSGQTVSTVIGIRIPVSYTRLTGKLLRSALQTNRDLNYQIYTGVGSEDFRVFPRTGFLVGGCADLVAAIHSSMIMSKDIERGVQVFMDAVSGSAEVIKGLNKLVQKQISQVLMQPADEQTWMMASYILMNAVLFHDRAAQAVGLPTRYELTSIKGGNSIDAGKLLNAWRRILTVDYYPIFNTAVSIVEKIGSRAHHDIMVLLFDATERIVSFRLQGASDLYGEIFQETVSERKKLAANYTRPECAMLLSSMALPPPNDPIWKNKEALTQIRIADFACGTGILLLSAYKTMALRYEINSHKSMSKLHEAMMGKCIIGADVLPIAAHLTASVLAGMYPDENFFNTQIYPVKQGGKRGLIGSLEWIQSEEKLDRSLIKMTSTGTAYENKVPPHHSCDVVIMNPPYSGTKSPGGRDDENNPGILFAAFGVSKPEQRLMTKRANMLFKKKACASSKAGLATFFMDLAHEKLKPGGKIGLVLPMTAATGTKWKNFRSMIAQKYTDVKVVSVRGTSPKETSMSGGTEIAEMLISAKKCNDGESPSGRGLFLSLERRPKSNLEAVIIGSSMIDTKANRLEDGPRGGSPIIPGTGNVVLDYPLKNSIWGGGGVEDYSLLQIGHLLDRGILNLSHKSSIKFDIVRLGEIATMGVSHLQIAGLGESNKESVSFNGPFRWPEPLTSASKYPVFWGLGKADTMQRRPDLALTPIPGEPQKRIDHVWKTASHVHIRSHLRTTSERLCFSYTDGLVIGGNLWPSVCIDPKYAKALVLWGNSTLGVLCRWQLSGKQHLGRSLIGLSDTKLIPVPNFPDMTKAVLREFDACFDRLRSEPLDIIMNMWKDAGRKSIDSAVLGALGASGLEPELAKLRKALCREPTINGGSLSEDLKTTGA